MDGSTATPEPEHGLKLGADGFMADWVVGAELLVVLESDCRRAVRFLQAAVASALVMCLLI